MSIRNRFVILFISFVVLITALLVVLTYISSKGLLEQNILTRSQDYFATFSDRLMNQIDEDRTNVLILAQVSQSKYLLKHLEPSLGNDVLVKRAEDELAELFFLYLKQHKSYDQIRLLDARGQERLRLERRDAKIEQVAGVDLQSKSHRDYFTQTIALKRHQLYTSEMDLNKEQGVIDIPYRPVIRYGTPVYDEDKVVGIIVINLDAKYMLAEMGHQAGNIYLVNEQGYFLKHHDRKKEYGFEFGNDFSIGIEYPDLFERMGASDQFIHVQKGFHKDFDDEYILGFKKIYFDVDRKERYWNLVFEFPSTFTFQSIDELSYHYGVISVLVILLGLCASIFVARNLSQPLAELNRVAQKIADGRFDVDIDRGERRDEIGELSRSLSVMVENLQANDEQATQRQWFEAGQTSLSTCMRGVTSIKELSRRIISSIARHIEAQCGVLYVVDENGNAQATGVFAPAGDIDLNRLFTSGDGLVGQVIADGELMLIEDLSMSGIRIETGIVDSSGVAVLILPVEMSGVVRMVVEVAKVAPFEERHYEYLKNISESIVVSLSHVQSGEQLAEAYERQTEMTSVLESQQEELQQSNEELQSINEELEEGRYALEDQRRTLIEKNNKVEHQATELRTASQYKSDFLANMSHELRTPLNSLLILSRMLSDNDMNNLTEQQIEYAKTIFDSGTDLLHLIDDILDLSKVEAGQLNVYCEPVDLRNVVERLNGLFKPLADSKGIELIVEYTGNPKSIHTDFGRLEQILRNLISNAIKFTEFGSVILRIHSTGDHLVTFEVSDTGIGMPKERLDEIFLPFQQLDSGISRRYSGTGLGLSIVRELTHLLGGSISVESVVSRGSIFKLVFPESLESSSVEHGNSLDLGKPGGLSRATLSSPVDSGVCQQISKEIIGQPDDIKRDDLSVLVIDDNDALVNEILKAASKLAYKHVAARNGAIGIHLAQRLMPSAIMVNRGLRGIEGHEVIIQLKENLLTRHIPVCVYGDGADLPVGKLITSVVGTLSTTEVKDNLFRALEQLKESKEKAVRSVLVVEDDSAQITSIRSVLTTDQLNVLVADSGQIACEMLHNLDIDCVVLDMGLHGELDGMDVLKRAADVLTSRNIPVIIYTSWDLTATQEKELRAHADSIIHKGHESQDRLFDEVALFLHQVVDSMPESKQRVLESLYARDCSLTGKRVLLVEDDMRNVYAMSSVLESYDIEVSVANDGVEALELANKNDNYDLIFMDIMMPIMDGYETIKNIRKIAAYTAIPIIALTAKTMNEDREQCLDSGASDYLAKPIDKDVMLSLLRVWFHKKAQL